MKTSVIFISIHHTHRLVVVMQEEVMQVVDLQEEVTQVEVMQVEVMQVVDLQEEVMQEEDYLANLDCLVN